MLGVVVVLAIAAAAPAPAHAVSRHVDLNVKPIKRGKAVVGARFTLVLLVEGDGRTTNPNIDDVRVGLGSLDPARWRKAGGGHGPAGASLQRGYLVHQWQLGAIPKHTQRKLTLDVDYAQAGLRSGQEVDVISAFLQRGSDLSAGFHTFGMALPMRDRTSVRTLP